MYLYIVLAKNWVLFRATFHEGAVGTHHEIILKPFNCLKLCMGEEEFCSGACIFFISSVPPLLPFFLKGGTKPISASWCLSFPIGCPNHLCTFCYSFQKDFRVQELPLARIKKIMKLDEDVKVNSHWYLFIYIEAKLGSYCSFP